MEEQPGDSPEPVFSFLGRRDMHPRQVPCWITHTNERTHDIIRGGLDRSPMYTGEIQGVGPRYCPSIEDKVVRFADKSEPPDLPRAGGADHARDLSQRHLHQPAVRRAARAGALDPRPGERAHRCGPATRSSTTTSIRATCSRRWRPRAIAGPVLRRPDQRHDRLRGGGRAGTARRAQRGAAARRAGDRWCPRRDEAYIGVLVDDLVTRGVSRALPHVHQPRRVPPAAARGQRRPAADRDRPQARPGR